jgi:hypothetical protein
MDEPTKPPPCDDEIFKKGHGVCILPPIKEGANEVERRIREVADATGGRTDWHYAGGRVVVKTLDSPVLVMATIVTRWPEWDKQGIRLVQ